MTRTACPHCGAPAVETTTIEAREPSYAPGCHHELHAERDIITVASSQMDHITYPGRWQCTIDGTAADPDDYNALATYLDTLHHHPATSRYSPRSD